MDILFKKESPKVQMLFNTHTALKNNNNPLNARPLLIFLFKTLNNEIGQIGINILIT